MPIPTNDIQVLHGCFLSQHAAGRSLLHTLRRSPCLGAIVDKRTGSSLLLDLLERREEPDGSRFHSS